MESGFFAKRRRWGDYECPDPTEIAEEARWLAEPAVAAMSVTAARGERVHGFLVTQAGVIDGASRLILEWLQEIPGPRPLLVPESLRPVFLGTHALAVPMRTPAWHAGVLALPLRSGWGPVARELECLGAEFALRQEAADRRAQLVFLRMAAVSPRPPARRATSCVRLVESGTRRSGLKARPSRSRAAR